MTRARPDNSPDRLADACRAHGLPVTVQRRTIFNAVEQSHQHPTADEVLEAVRGALPDLSRTTVYRVLEKLVELGVVRKVSAPGSAARYDAGLHRHHHLVCRVCERIFDLEDEQLDRAVRIGKLKSNDFAVEDFSVYLHGVCGACGTQADGRAAPTPARRGGARRT